jgi:hypothetical protein
LGFLAVIVAVLTTFGWLHSDISDIRKDVATNSQSITKIESAVKIIADRQGSDTQGLVDDVLAAAKVQQQLGNPSVAARILNHLPEVVANGHMPTQSIEATAQKLLSLRSSPNQSVSHAALKGMTALATYRSSLTSVPSDFHPQKTLTSFSVAQMVVINGQIYISGALLTGRAVDNTGGQGFDID